MKLPTPGHDTTMIISAIVSSASTIMTTALAWARFFKKLDSANRMTLNDLRNSKVFDRLGSMLLEYGTLTYKCPIRRTLFRTIITIQIQSFTHVLRDLIYNSDVGELSPTEFVSKWDDLIAKVHADNYKKFVEANIPEIVIAMLNNKLQVFVNLTKSHIARVCSENKTYPNNYVKTATIAWGLIDRIASTVPSIIEELNTFNGAISSLKIGGYTRDDCTDVQCPCNKIDLGGEIVKLASSVYTNSTCVKSRPECAWHGLPDDLSQADPIDVLTAMFRCTQCTHGIKADCKKID